MPMLIVFGAGVLGGMWLRSEADTNGTSTLGNAGTLVKWSVIGGAAYLAYRRFS
ncbi:hypothetical protein [Oceanibaculum indicum]|uniref:Uncharacterized protein n=1 Tax=Oceanibaculum indicum TaxID=526216 RepID=A0A420WPZ5_9PROT|nr:hypothetical protein [Oceanibaculum indicum]RKQ73113.1 hypothetical protein BCL74_0886 [Oceanibaculum indicum]